jgi:hypothetical protein
MFFINAAIHDWKDIGSMLFMDLTKKKKHMYLGPLPGAVKKRAL